MEQVINNFVINLNSIGRGFCDYAGNMFVQSGILIILFLTIDFLLRKRIRAVFRYCIWMLVFVKLILPPTLSSPTGIGYWSGDFLSINWFASKPIFNMPDAESVKPIMPEEAEISAIPLQTEPVQSIFEAPTSATTAISNLPSLTWQGIVFFIWLVGVLIFSSLLIQRMFFVRSLLLQSEPAQGRLLDTLNQCLQQIGIRRSIELRLSSNLQSPAVCGLIKPVILIPTSLLERLSRDKLRAVLIHELAHIKRGDLWVNLIQTLLQIIYFYNPFVWLANIVVRRIREQAVDEAVLVALGNEAESYSNTLIDIAEMVFWKANFSLRLIGVAESKNALHRRIKHILTRPIPKSAKLGVLGLIVVAILAAVLLPMAKGSSRPPGFLIKGTVVDAETKRPIAGAKVGDVERYAGGEQWTVTDSNGAYSYLTWYEEHGIKCEAPGYKKQHKGFYTKLIGSEKEKVLNFELTPTDFTQESKSFTATLPNGVTVELMGICEHPSEGKQWWRPDGSHLGMSIITEDKSQYTSDYPGYEIAFKVDGKDFNFKRGGVKDSKESSGLDVIEPEGIIACRVHIKPGIKKTKITAGAASGQWSTIAKHNGQGITSRTFEAKKIILSAANESKEGLVMTITDNICFAEAIRLIAIDKNGSTFTGNMQTGLSDSGLAQSTFIFANLSLNSVKEFQFQIRPYQWVTFKNVSLQPNFKTDVQVEAGEKGKEVEGVDITPANFDIRLNQERRICNLVVSIQNESRVTIPEFKLKFYRGDPSNNLDEAGNVHSGWHEAGPIEPSKRWNECTRDFHLPDGQYEFNVLLDYDNSISETDEINNQASMTVVVKDGNIVEKSVEGVGAFDK